LHEGSVIPAKAGIHPLPFLDAGLRRHDKSMKEPVEGGWAISYAVDERKLMNTSWCTWCSCHHKRQPWRKIFFCSSEFGAARCLAMTPRRD
jgi:hypothetical protein